MKSVLQKIFIHLLRGSKVEGNQGYGATFRHHFVSVLHEVMVHSTLLPKCRHDSRISLECWECKKYQTCYVIMSRYHEVISQLKKLSLTHLYFFITNSCLFYMKSLVAMKTHLFQTSGNCVNKAIISYTLCLFCCR